MKTKLYQHEIRAIERNRATANERLAHNKGVDAERRRRAMANALAFVPRKASVMQRLQRLEARLT